MRGSAIAVRRGGRQRGFSLLEVMMAAALFGAVVTTILSAQAGLMAGNRSAANMSQAVELGRCRMTELEEKQLKLGFPEIEEKDTSPICCDEREVPGFSCDWQVDRVTLPQSNGLSEAGAGSILGGSLSLDNAAGSAAPGVPPSLAGQVGSMLVNPAGGAQLDLDAGLQNIGQSLQQSFGGAGGAQGLLNMVFTLVYPSLKPLLESAIRRITVVVRWDEGPMHRDFTLVQYVTNPSRAGLLAGMADAGAFGEGGGR
ncbi:MAG: prepilin-type N-terminal cleavage/methylation domain-containing protein [Myxococcota bacterium]|nr:prepilin-type N-terminal cleavage/methylation domain-containing protein [Myxococcota bacterium]